MKNLKLKFHIPTQRFGFLEIEGTQDDLDEMKKYYNEYADEPISFGNNKFKELETFTGEKVLYNDDKHEYKDLNGNRLLSGSKYKKNLEKEFDLENISKAVADKLDLEQADIKDMWSGKSKVSCEFGDAIHDAMENWFKYRDLMEGTDKDYHLPSHKWLKEVVLDFPLKDESIKPEVVVSDIENKMVGRIDGLWITGKKCQIIDYKTDRDINKNLEGHFNQLSFYAHILKNKGWKVENLIIFNYTDKWEKYENEVLDLIK